mmetsp:Transcript_24988/g.23979  ORF Transcript_24988/g.23979 Transcript_24988/m.23979 type:complete len:87 (-) Transcript_24988:27-287(-)|eukprot:CAMPEP_0197837528 /NCGR_PEP_ID=MMETSP1437-20131217/32414_1 /TAXON_ID=49252 ORGANISM="Eucampia antarctica, Strain CCMP1452" /NCGR_SAMPLE_ID=MMETSP1437 /ASSEMBLY_ACC=CAM_ASM_001096 /LENGTH=86 /DNA_ID=CAMNT_0043444629 /DNA_START=118 /DNA_END=378 /DNA_ORIENTATION=+
MTEVTDVDMPTTTGGPTSGNVNNAHVSTTPSQTETSAPTSSKYKGKNKNGGKGPNNNKNNANTVPSVNDSFEGMTPAIKIFLSLPG